MLPGGTGKSCMIWHMFPALDLYYADPAQSPTMAVEDDLYDLYDLDRDLSQV